MKNKSAIITGSTSGIGLTIARYLAKEGCHIMLNGFGDRHEIENLQQKLSAQNKVRVLYSDADMTNPEQIAGMVQSAAGAFGGVDILINNVGIQYVAPIDEFPIEKWNAIIAINLSAAFHTIRAALPYMKKKNWGRIINIASAHGLVASPYKSAYVAAKHGIVGLTKVVALETARIGITCNAICPGYVKTPLVEGQIKDQAKSRGISEKDVVHDVILESQPTKKFVGLDEVGALTVFLAGDDAASITGTAISIDGGWTAQ
jgi:3-hydroxybutyrate dehydrogenase